MFFLVPSKGCPAQDKWRLITKGLSSEASATRTWQAQAICMRALSSLWERREGGRYTLPLPPREQEREGMGR